MPLVPLRAGYGRDHGSGDPDRNRGTAASAARTALDGVFAAELDRLVSDRPPVPELLARLCRMAVVLAPPTVFAGVAIAFGGDQHTHACSHVDLVELDRNQYRGDGGPGLSAAARNRPVTVNAGRAPITLGRFAGRAAAHGFRSVVALPMRADAISIGALTLYATRPGAYDRRSIDRAQAFADGAARLVVELGGRPAAQGTGRAG